MKFSMMSYTIGRGKKPGEFDLKAMCDLTCELGMEAIDFVGLHGYEPEEVRKTVDEYQLKVCCYTFHARFNAPTPEDRKAAEESFKQGVEIAQILGTDKIMLPLPATQGLTRQESQRFVLDGLKNTIDVANAAGITTTVENFCGHEHTPICTSDEFLMALAEVPDLRLTYDNGNILTGGEDPAESFAKTSDYIVHAHFKDWQPPVKDEGFVARDGRNYRGALIGEGIVDQIACLKAMKAAGYSGYINIEYEGARYTPENATRMATKWLQGVLAALA